MRSDERQPGQPDDPAQDPPVREDLPERENPVGAERRAQSVEEEAQDGVEREDIPTEGDGAGVETPPREAERADLTP